MEENPENLKKLIPRFLNFRGQRLISSARQGKHAGGTAPIQIINSRKFIIASIPLIAN
jgi:hypothetical protein